ncbi:MAG: AAA family ATPase [Streptosporangiaceae bacterium]
MSRADAIRDASVLLAFRAENVRSFRDEFELSLLSTRLADEDVVRLVTWREGGRPIGVLPVAGVFGANASGKSNVLKAMDDMRGRVLHSFRAGSPTGGISRNPFLLDQAGQREPSRFEVDLVLEGVRFEYGFALDDERVLEEWAYRYPHGKAVRLFHRRDSCVEHGSAERARGRAVEALLRPNALFLSTAASANHPVLLPIYAWFARNLRLAEASSREFRQALTTQLLNDDARRGQVLALLRAADLGITGARKYELDPVMKERLQRAVRILAGQEGEPDGTDEGPSFDQLGVRLIHRGGAGEVELDTREESLGTLVWFGLVGPIIEALADGAVLLVDELDASLHPALVAELIRLFQDPESNPRRAQLVFNSHDASILGDSTSTHLMGRDQIWFTDKRADGSTRLYPLSDLDPRKEEAVGRRYLAGRYGAVPILSRQEFDASAELITSGDRS